MVGYILCYYSPDRAAAATTATLDTNKDCVEDDGECYGEKIQRKLFQNCDEPDKSGEEGVDQMIVAYTPSTRVTSAGDTDTAVVEEAIKASSMEHSHNTLKHSMNFIQFYFLTAEDHLAWLQHNVVGVMFQRKQSCVITSCCYSKYVVTQERLEFLKKYEFSWFAD